MAYTAEQVEAMRVLGMSPEAFDENIRARNLLKSLYDDSAVGFDFRKIVKKKYPDASMPELESVQHVENLGTDLNKRFEELATGTTKKIDEFLDARQKEKDEAALRDYQTRFEKVVKDRGYTEDGEKKLLEMMKTKNIRDPEDAAILFESMQPKTPKPARQFSSRMNFVSPDNKDDEGFARLMEDPEQFMVDEMLNALGNAGSSDD